MPVAAKSENTRRDIPQAERSDSVLRDSKRIFSSQPQKSKRKRYASYETLITIVF